MTTWTATSFLGGHPALDFVNTVGGRTKDRSVEWLREFADAADWARAARILDNAEHEYLLARAEGAHAEASEALTDLRAQREALHDFLLAAIEDTDCPAMVRKRVEVDIATAHREAHLSDRYRTQPAWVTDVAELGLRVLAVRVALASAALLASDERFQIGACGRCSWLYLDPSPSRRRRWCSMATCGNRAKAERHQRRSDVGGR
ncbi:CGNR zinc finger domain-containing protein [Streptomyces sp. bgisy022]|uniref:CGNR zinc finger domain-containing protein n=1 Tax=Streptomyces sp. bgisy022 TaxID=3413769 RepID=UPI003D727D80